MAFTDRLHNRGSITSGYDVSNSILMSGDDLDRGEYTYASGGNRYTQTFSMWVKRVKPGANEYLFETGNADSLEGRLFARFQSDNRLRVSTGTSLLRQTLMEFNDTAAWYHIVIVIDNTQSTAQNRCKIYVNGRDVEPDGWDASNNMNQNQNTGCGVGNLYLNFSGIDSNGHSNQYIAQFATLNGQNLGPGYFAETNADGEWVPKDLTSLSWGNHDMWLQFDKIGYGTSHRYWKYQAHSTTNHVPRASRIYLIKEDGSTQNFKEYTSDNCNDQGGIMAVASGSTTYSDDSNTEYTIDLGSAQNVQGYGFYGTYGAASRNVTAKLYYSDNGSSWTEDQSNSISTDGCGEYNRYRGSSGLGADSSGQGHNMTLNAVDATNQSQDSPTNNFCIMNNNSRTNGNIHSEHGGTYIKTDGGSGWCTMNATFGAQNGKWYWEVHFFNDPGDTNTVMIGLAGWNDPWIPHRAGGYYTGNVATGGSIGWYFVNGNLYNDANYGDITGPGYGQTAMIALDMDSSDPKAYFGVNGTWATPTGGTQQNPASGTNGVNLASCFSGVPGAADIILPSVSVYQGNEVKYMNFGGYTKTTLASTYSDANGYGTFEHEPPSGFYALCSKNLGEFG